MNQGHKIIHLSTSKSGDNIFKWNPVKNKIDDRCVENVDVVIHLAGANIFSSSWTPARKKEIIDSRVKGIEIIKQACIRQNVKIRHFISASGVGYYGNRPDEIVTEESTSGSGFAAEVCRLWEDAAKGMKEVSEKVSVLRIGIVFSEEGGFIREMKKLSDFRLLAPLGSGKQMISWIHIDDLCRIFEALTTGKISEGIYNAVSPNPMSNAGLTSIMNKKWKSFNWPLNVPEFMLKLILGERAIELTGGQAASSEKLEKAGFEFQHTDALKAI